MNWLSLDVETSGTLPEHALQPWRVRQGKAWLTTIATTQVIDKAPVRWGTVYPSRGAIRAVLRDAIQRKQTVIGWNITFDIAWLLAYGLEEEVFQLRWLDGMRVWKHAFIEPEYEMDRSKKKRYRLKPEAVELVVPWMAGYNEDIDYHTRDPEQLRKLMEYNKDDTLAALLITKHFWDKLDGRQKRAALLEAECLPMVAAANLEGMRVDHEKLSALRAEVQAGRAETAAKLQEFGVTETIIRSPAKLATLLFDDWKLPVLKTNVSKLTGKETRSTDKEVLHELAFMDSRCKLVRAWRESLNLESKFIKTLEISPCYNGDERTHPEAIVLGTYTGRMTYVSTQGRGVQAKQTGFAIHQMKNDPRFRSLIRAPGDDEEVIEFDASGQEFRWMAIMSGDKTMLELCRPGEDAHSFMGARISGRDYKEIQRLNHEDDKAAKVIRKSGKVANLSLQYRTSPKRLMITSRVNYDMLIELPESQHIWNTYRQTYLGVPVYWKSQIAFAKEFGFVETLAGRRVYIEGNWSGDLGWSMESTAINFPIQGVGGDQKYLALAVLKPYIREHNIRFAWDLHDGLYFYVPRASVERAMVDMKQILDNLPYERAWGFTPPIPLPWDAKRGSSWGTLHGDA